MKTLKDAKIGETVKVVKLTGEGPVKRRIMDMGITKGTEVFVRKVAPLGDPMEVTVRGYELSLAQSGYRNDRGRVNFWRQCPSLCALPACSFSAMLRKNPRQSGRIACGFYLPDEKSDGACNTQILVQFRRFCEINFF